MIARATLKNVASRRAGTDPYPVHFQTLISQQAGNQPIFKHLRKLPETALCFQTLAAGLGGKYQGGASRPGSAFHVLPERIGQIGAQFIGHAASRALDFLHEAVEIVARPRDGCHTQSG
jgi:hypothetical protein